MIETQANREKKDKNLFVDFLKGICIIFVVITHFNWTDSERTRLLFPFWIDMAVPIFMMISGYVSGISVNKKNIDHLENFYSLNILFPKFLRYSVPYLIFISVEVILCKGGGYSVYEIFISSLSGGVGPGSYYYPVMMQFVIIFPVLFFVIRKFGLKGVLSCGFMNLGYEILKIAWGMGEACYRMIAFRYVLFIAIGIYLGIGKRTLDKRVMAASFGMGISFIILVNYLGYKPLIFKWWSTTCLVVALYIAPVFSYLIRKKHRTNKFIELLGRASYNIMFSQMIYYVFFAEQVYRSISDKGLELAVSVLLCVSGGLIFYRIENQITGNILKEIIKKANTDRSKRWGNYI